MTKLIRLTVITALFSAMITALTLFPKIPSGMGYIHLGDSIIFLAACIIPTSSAVLAAGIGGLAADFFGGFPVYIIPTFIIKALISLPFSHKSNRILTERNALMLIPAGLITVVGYMITFVVLYGSAGIIACLLGDLIQAAGSSALFVIIAAALDKINFKQRI